MITKSTHEQLIYRPSGTVRSGFAKLTVSIHIAAHERERLERERENVQVGIERGRDEREKGEKELTAK